MFRRRRRPARLPGRRRARHRTRDDPPARRRAQRLWHGPRRHGGAAAADASRGAIWTRSSPSWRRRRAPRSARRAWRRRNLLRRAALRYDGSDSSLEVPVSDHMREAFEAAHKARFGFTAPETAVVVETAIVEAVGGHRRAGEGAPCEARRRAQSERPSLRSSRPSAGEDLYDRGDLSPGDTITGPALIIDPSATTVVEPGWRAEVDALGNLILTRAVPRAAAAAGAEADPVMLEVMANLFMAIAEEMGVALQNTASSVNIKERLDFSCAVFDREGDLIANAPHIPVHLGSMGDSIRTIIAARGDGARRQGHEGGRRLCAERPLSRRHPPSRHHRDHAGLRAGDDAAPAWFVAARGHHADIGGIAPGSMPPDSRDVHEEGVLIDNMLLVDAGPLPRGGAARLARRGRVAGAQSGPQRRRSEGAGRRLRARRERAAAGGGRIWPRRDRRLYGPCHGLCRRGGAAAGRAARATAPSPTRWTMARRFRSR